MCGRSPSSLASSTCSWLLSPCPSSPRLLLSVGFFPQVFQCPTRFSKLISNLLILFELPCELLPLTHVRVYSHTCAELLVFSSPQRTARCLRAQDRPDGFAGPVLAVLAAGPHLRLPVTHHCSCLHAGVQSHVLSALYTCQHFPGEKYLPEHLC